MEASEEGWQQVASRRRPQGTNAISGSAAAGDEASGDVSPDPSSNAEARLLVTCRFFVGGFCRAGSTCRFYHPQVGPRSSPSTTVPSLRVSAAIPIVAPLTVTPLVSTPTRWTDEEGPALADDDDDSEWASDTDARDAPPWSSPEEDEEEEEGGRSPSPDDSLLGGSVYCYGAAMSDSVARGIPEFYAPPGAPRPMAPPVWDVSGRPAYRDVVGCDTANSPFCDTIGVYSPGSANDNIPYDREMRRKLCLFYQEGSCRYGDYCLYEHGTECPICLKKCLSSDPSFREAHLMRCRRQREMDKAREADSQYECGICYESVVNKGSRFGILNGCEHTFCLDCIRSWRGTDGPAKNAIRACPICRVESHFVIPSERYVPAGAQKEALIAAYKSNMAKIPCRHFDRGRGRCPFAGSCFYAHLNPDGTPATPEKPRLYIDAEGSTASIQTIRLSDFL